MNNLTDKEKLIYQIMGTVANSRIPIIYKGAMVTKLLLLEKDFSMFNRETQDIDASWNDIRLPSMESLTAMLNEALAALAMKAVVKREYGDKKSAGFDIIYKNNGELAVSMDIDMRIEKSKKEYHYGDITFLGATADQILSDKIHVLSTEKAYRRVKDAVDVYALSYCVKVQARTIRRLWKEAGRVQGTFEAVSTRVMDLEHAYNKLKRVSPKPEFTVVLERLKIFLTPFIEKTTQNLTWDSNNHCWEKPH